MLLNRVSGVCPGLGFQRAASEGGSNFGELFQLLHPKHAPLQVESVIANEVRKGLDEHLESTSEMSMVESVSLGRLLVTWPRRVFKRCCSRKRRCEHNAPYADAQRQNERFWASASEPETCLKGVPAAEVEVAETSLAGDEWRMRKREG